MQTVKRATRAYQAAATHRSQRQQEADVFHRVIGVLKAARTATPISRARAVADNRRLWIAVNDLMRDPTSPLPAPLRAGIISVGISVNRVMDQTEPDLDYLIAINEQIAAGLSESA